MKSMKGLSMNKMLGSIKRKGSGSGSREASPAPDSDHPDAVAGRCVRQFCESGGPGTTGDEVTFLPSIVDAAESSPAAAAECARLIRKYLHRDYFSKPSFQYNAIMLLRILSDNPGMTFTRNIDKKFVDAAKDQLRNGRDLSVRQMLMETLDSFETTKEYDTGLTELVAMWKKEKEKAYKEYGGRPPPAPGVMMPQQQMDPRQQQNYFARNHNSRRLPDPVELSSRLEEAKTSAKLLDQVVACTPPSEFLSNELIREFADRCQSASRSIQGYMSAENPAPDNDTMEHLIDTNEHLQQALNLHQRALLNAKKQLGLNERSAEPSPAPPANRASYPSAWQGADSQASSSRPDLNSSQAPPPPPSRKPVGNGKGKAVEPLEVPADGGASSRPTNGSFNPSPNQGGSGDDPFRDPPIEPSSSAFQTGRLDITPDSPEAPRLAFEPFHPGFNTTPSYLNRQDSAMNKVAMHGGATAPEPKATSRRDDDDEDLYDK